MSANEVPEDLLPKPIQGTMANTAASRVGATMPRPGGAKVTETPAAPSPEAESDAPVIDLRPQEPTVTPAAPKKKATPTKPRQQAKPTAPANPIQLAISLPESLLGKVDDDPRSRADLLRDAFGNHAKAVTDSQPKPTAKPTVTGMRPRSTRRTAPVNDSFCEARFRLHPDEVAALDEWQAKTPLTRSAFVTELLKAELD